MSRSFILSLALLCFALGTHAAVSLTIKLTIGAEDGGVYGNYAGARSEFHCIDEEAGVVQGAYGKFAAFWGTYENHTAEIQFAENNGARGEAWITYAEDFSWVNGTWKYDGNDTLYKWIAINGSTGGVNEEQDCLWATGSTTAEGKWTLDSNTDYICIDGTTVTGSYKFYEEGDSLEYGTYSGKTFESAAHYTSYWNAKTGPYAGERGPQLIKTTGSGIGAKQIGYFCYLVSQDSDALSECEFYTNERVENGVTASNCVKFPEPLASLPLSISLTIDEQDSGSYGTYNGSLSEFHCIDQWFNVQGTYGKYGVFWGTIYENMTAFINYADYTFGSAWLSYEPNWSAVTGTYTIVGDEGVYEWSAVQGVVNQANWTTQCLFTSSVSGSLNGHWKGDETESYFCLGNNNTTLTGSYRWEVESEVEYGLYKNGTVFGGKNAAYSWVATSGTGKGDVGYQIMKGEFDRATPVVNGFWCYWKNNTEVFSECYYFQDARVEGGVFTTECANFPVDETATTTATADESSAMKVAVAWLAVVFLGWYTL